MINNKRKVNIKFEELPFTDFLTSRYSMTVRVNAKKTYEYAKENNLSFFNITVACMLKAINEIPEFKRRIIDNEIFEYDFIDAVSPLMQEDNSLKEIRIEPVSEDDSLDNWNKSLEERKSNISDNEFSVDPSIRDSLPICNMSCIPWLDFDSMTNIIASSNQIMPVISWGKYVDGKISVSLTASHIFIFGYHFKLFYEKLEYYLENIEKL